MTNRARRTLTALLLAAAAAITPLAVHAGQDHHTQADSIWGVVAPATPAPTSDPAPAPAETTAADATPQDSIWG